MTMAKVDQSVPEATPQGSALLKCEKCGRVARIWLDGCEYCSNPTKNWYEDRLQQLEKKLASEERVNRDYVDKLNSYSSGTKNMQETIISLERELRDKDRDKKIASLQYELKGRTKTNGEKAAKIVALKEQVDHQARAILSLEARTKHDDGIEIAQLRDAIVMQQKDVDNQQERLEAKQERIEEQKATMGQQQRRIDDQATLIQCLEEQRTTASSATIALEQHCKEQVKHVQEQDVIIGGQYDKISGLHDRTHAAEAALHNIKNSDEYLESQVNKIEELEKDVGSLKKELASKSTYICLVAKQKAALEHKLKDFANLRAENCQLNDTRQANRRREQTYKEWFDRVRTAMSMPGVGFDRCVIDIEKHWGETTNLQCDNERKQKKIETLNNKRRGADKKIHEQYTELTESRILLNRLCAAVDIHGSGEYCVTQVEANWATIAELQTKALTASEMLLTQEGHREVFESTIAELQQKSIERNALLQRVCTILGTPGEPYRAVVDRLAREWGDNAVLWAKFNEAKALAKNRLEPGEAELRLRGFLDRIGKVLDMDNDFYMDVVAKVEKEWAPMLGLHEEMHRKVEEIASCRDSIILRNEWLHRICAAVGVKLDQKAWAVAKVEKGWAKITKLKHQLREAKKKKSIDQPSIAALRERHVQVNTVASKTQQLMNILQPLASQSITATLEHTKRILLYESEKLMARIEAHPEYSLYPCETNKEIK